MVNVQRPNVVDISSVAFYVRYKPQWLRQDLLNKTPKVKDRWNLFAKRCNVSFRQMPTFVVFYPTERSVSQSSTCGSTLHIRVVDPWVQSRSLTCQRDLAEPCVTVPSSCTFCCRNAQDPIRPRLTAPRFPLVFTFQMSLCLKAGHIPEGPKIVDQIPNRLVPYNAGSRHAKG